MRNLSIFDLFCGPGLLWVHIMSKILTRVYLNGSMILNEVQKSTKNFHISPKTGLKFEEAPM